MIKSLQVALAWLLTSLILIASLRADSDKSNSPEDVFKAFAAAQKNHDMKVMMSHMTSDSQSGLAGGMWFGAEFQKSLMGLRILGSGPTPKEQKQIAAIEAALKRHGLSDNKLMKFLERNNKVEATEDERYVALGKLVNDKPGFVKEILKVMDPTSGAFNELGAAKMTEVKIGGQRAKGRAKFTGADGKENTATIYFQLEGGIWKIDLIETNRSWPRPPPAQPAATPVQQPVTQSNSRPGFLRRLCSCLHSR